MAVSTTVTTAGIAVLLCVLSTSWADYWPGDAEFQNICRTIIDEVSSNCIRRRGLGSGGQIEVHETLTRQQLCDRLVLQHETHNAAYLWHSSVTTDECLDVLSGEPEFYTPEKWNNWRGRHCGSWQSTDGAGGANVGMAERDDALWNYAQLSYGIYYRQTVDFTRRDPCCEDGWNESGGTEVVVWGWDPKEPVQHFGWQGSHVGWPFTSDSGADCIVWLTGEEAFLECIKTMGSTKRRSSAGFWGYGQWRVQSSPTHYCCADRRGCEGRRGLPGLRGPN